MTNVFDHLPAASAFEEFTELLTHGGTRVERIVSTGQSTPEDILWDQDHGEWMLLLKGAARLWIDSDGERELRPGDHLLIPVHRRHRVTWTAKDETTVWLAIHFDGADRIS